ncbi:MAG: serine--tRNA ligase, partial [Patescibacteria group bacterium]
MLDIKLLREELDKVKEGIQKKGANPAMVDDFLAVDREWRELVQELDKLRAEQKKLSEERKTEDPPSLELRRARAKTLKEKIKGLEEGERETGEEREALLSMIPNLPLPDVPVGKDETENRVVRKWGEPTKFAFEPKDHVAFGEALDVIDIKRAAKVSGTRFGYLKGDAALLEFALIQFG